jgi:hypothetical protein
MGGGGGCRACLSHRGRPVNSKACANDIRRVRNNRQQEGGWEERGRGQLLLSAKL